MLDTLVEGLRVGFKGLPAVCKKFGLVTCTTGSDEVLGAGVVCATGTDAVLGAGEFAA